MKRGVIVMKLKSLVPALGLGLFIFMSITTARAQVSLRFTPDDINVDPGAGGRLSLMIDDALEVRTIDVVVHYDPSIVLSVDGGAGALYTETGVYTFQGFENDTPGEWHGYAVLMGAGLFVQGAGELYYWDFEGLNIGRSWIETIEVSLAATDGSWYENVSLETTSIIVGDLSDVPVNSGAKASRLQIHPNPFNPKTLILLPPGNGESAVLSILDARGRKVRTLWTGRRDSHATSLVWDGTTDTGRSAGSGSYLFVLKQDSGSSLIGRGCLVR
jgi:flagellar hook capping protein FlgD